MKNQVKLYLFSALLLFISASSIHAQNITFSGPDGVTSVASGTILALKATGQTAQKFISSVPSFGYSNYYDNSINGDVTCDLWETNYDTGVFKYKFVNNGSVAKKIKFLFVNVKITTVSNGVYSTTTTNIEFEMTVEPASPIYRNVAKSFTFYKNNCNQVTENGGAVSYTVPAGTYSSTVSQAEADRFAENAIFLYGQNYANANGTCTINPNKLITYTEFPQVSDTFAVLVYWNKNKISSSTVSFEVYQYGVLKGVVASNISNSGMANLNIIQYLQIDGHTFRNVRLKLISDADPSVNEFTPGLDWLID